MDNDAKQILKHLAPGALCAMVITACVFMSKNPEQQSAPVKTIKDTNIETVNSQIKNAHKRIDSLHCALNQTGKQSTPSNPLHTHKSAAHRQMDSLADANNNLILRAYLVARKQSPMRTPKKDLTVFTDFADVPAVKRAHKQFTHNMRLILALKKQISNADITTQKNIADAQRKTFAEIQTIQKQIDSLLNMKDSLIAQKLK
jgi:hypothetical protein